jgi:hypothetical protein
MKVTGESDLKDHGDEIHVRQKPGTSEHWQDSVVLTWWDTKNEIGGFHRLGHQPNYKDGPMVTLWSSLMSPVGTYKKTTFQPLREEDLLPSGGFGCGDDTCTVEYIDGEHIWNIQDGEVSAQLRFTDISGNVDPFPKKGSLAEDFAAAHFDIPGTVTGWMKMKGKEWKINGLGIRDHGWGKRDWSTILSHRWVVGTCGRELSFVVLAWHSSDDALVKFGWVVRGNELTRCKEIDIVTYMEIDSATHRGGHMTLKLTTDEVLEIEFKAFKSKAAISYHHGVACVDQMCSWTCNSLSGISDFEITSNFQRNNRVPKNSVAGITEDGFFPLVS